MRADLQRAIKELSNRHRQLLEARSQCENSRKEQNRFDIKLKRCLGVARVLPQYQMKIENAMRSLNETETRLNFKKGELVSQVNAAKSRRDEVKHRHDLLVKSIQQNQQKLVAIAADINKVRAEITGTSFAALACV